MTSVAPAPLRVAVVGTDVKAGKTIVAAALAALLVRRGRRVAVMKPVETGVADGAPAPDAELLHLAAGGRLIPDDVCPVVLAEPLVPWVAARRARRPVDLEAIEAAFRRLERGRDAMIVEGTGGALDPLTPTTSWLDLFGRWGLDAVVVAVNRVGAINHVLLTVHALEDAGIRIRGVVLDAAAPGPLGVVERTNREALGELLPELPVLSLGWVTRRGEPAALADAAEASGLERLLG